jgi:hypothetical protein
LARLQDRDPDAAGASLGQVVAWSILSARVVFGALGVYLGYLGVLAIRRGEYPPPGLRVGSEPLVTGAAARTRAVVLLLAAAVLLLGATLGVQWFAEEAGQLGG